MVLSWSIEEINLSLLYNWKISRNETSFKRNFIIHLNDGVTFAKGEVAPNIRYGETPEVIQSKFDELIPLISKTTTLDDLIYILDNNYVVNSLRFGIESCFVHFLSNKKGLKVYEFLGLPKPSQVFTSYTLPIMEPGKIATFIDNHKLLRFKYLKVKIDNESGLDIIEELSKITTHPLRIDANEAWQDVDSLLVFMEKCRDKNIDFFEQPLPSVKKEEYKYLKKISPFELIADESLSYDFNMDELAEQFHGVNMKLMKSGGYLKGIEILKSARNKQLKTMIGCMVETSLGIFSAINLCSHINYIDLDGHFLVENEPFSLVSEENGCLYNII